MYKIELRTDAIIACLMYKGTTAICQTHSFLGPVLETVLWTGPQTEFWTQYTGLNIWTRISITRCHWWCSLMPWAWSIPTSVHCRAIEKIATKLTFLMQYLGTVPVLSQNQINKHEPQFISITECNGCSYANIVVSKHWFRTGECRTVWAR